MISSISTQTQLANQRRVPRALRLLGVFPEACSSSGHAQFEPHADDTRGLRRLSSYHLTPHVGRISKPQQMNSARGAR